MARLNAGHETEAQARNPPAQRIAERPWAGPGDTVPEFEAALRPLAEGEITPEPVLTRHGWHVIRMDALAQGAVLPFEAVRGRIADAMEKAAWARTARDYINQLVASAEISGANHRSV